MLFVYFCREFQFSKWCGYLITVPNYVLVFMPPKADIFCFSVLLYLCMYLKHKVQTQCSLNNRGLLFYATGIGSLLWFQPWTIHPFIHFVFFLPHRVKQVVADFVSPFSKIPRERHFQGSTISHKISPLCLQHDVSKVWLKVANCTEYAKTSSNPFVFRCSLFRLKGTLWGDLINWKFCVYARIQ